MKKDTFQAGVALIQVLLIIGILSVLVLYFSQTSRQQVKLAQLASDRAQAYVDVHHAKNNLLMMLLTNERSASIDDRTSNSAAAVWNFHGEVFAADNKVTATMQDQAGLLSVHFLDSSRLVRLLEGNGINRSDAETVVRNLFDWFDADNLTPEFGSENALFETGVRNGPITQIEELAFVPGVTPEVLTILKKSLSTLFIDALNPLTAPETVLRGLMEPVMIEQIIEMRTSRMLDRRQFVQMTGIAENDVVRYFPSNTIALTLARKIGEVSLRKQWIIDVNPYAINTSPVNVIETRR